MTSAGVFQAVVKASLDRVAAIEVRHTQVSAGREIVLSHMIYRNVFTEFDSRLSRHLAAVSGRGFPVVSVRSRWRAHGTNEPWRQLEETEFPSVPHALASIGARALEGGRESAVLRLHHHELAASERAQEGERRVFTADDLAGHQRALAITDMLGEPPFVEISGDFDLVVAHLPGAEVAPLVVDLATGRLHAAESNGIGAVAGAIYDTDRIFAKEGAGRAYMAATRRAVLGAKQDAVLDFRAAAEKRILDFDGALKGRRLAGHRLEAAAALVRRLKAGLGESLAGLSEHAQLTAFDWQAELDEDTGEATGRSVWQAHDGHGDGPTRAYA